MIKFFIQVPLYIFHTGQNIFLSIEWRIIVSAQIGNYSFTVSGTAAASVIGPSKEYNGYAEMKHDHFQSLSTDLLHP